MWSRQESTLSHYIDQVRVPSLIQGVKDLGLLVGTFGTQDELALLPTSSGADPNGVDAALQDGVLTYFNSYRRIQ